MGCGCRGNKSNNSGNTNKGNSLENFAYLTPAQLRLREAQREAEKKLKENK